ncbi:MAG: serine/threonine protein phosphatase, partial [Dysgonamonadaceae bacterium]|nr:serine/threonine protein phosphatase [Dysgonamonadaceae bacterium]
VTHCPPKNILDENGRWGCPILRELIDGAAPQIHIFGHSHKTGGQSVQEGKTLFWNVAVKQM